MPWQSYLRLEQAARKQILSKDSFLVDKKVEENQTAEVSFIFGQLKCVVTFCGQTIEGRGLVARQSVLVQDKSFWLRYDQYQGTESMWPVKAGKPAHGWTVSDITEYVEKIPPNAYALLRL